MLARVFAFLPLVLLVSASHLEARDDQCNTSDQNCCNSVQSLSEANDLLGFLGIVEAAVAAGGQVGLNCSPLSVIAVGGGSTCTEQPVCCTDNDFNGLVNFGCSPLNL